MSAGVRWPSHTSMRNHPRQPELCRFWHFSAQPTHSLWSDAWTASASETNWGWKERSSYSFADTLCGSICKNWALKFSAHSTCSCATALVDRNGAGSDILALGRLIRCDEAHEQHQRARYIAGLKRTKLVFFCKYAFQKYLQKTDVSDGFVACDAMLTRA